MPIACPLMRGARWLPNDHSWARIGHGSSGKQCPSSEVAALPSPGRSSADDVNEALTEINCGFVGYEGSADYWG